MKRKFASAEEEDFGLGSIMPTIEEVLIEESGGIPQPKEAPKPKKKKEDLYEKPKEKGRAFSQQALVGKNVTEMWEGYLKKRNLSIDEEIPEATKGIQSPLHTDWVNIGIFGVYERPNKRYGHNGVDMQAPLGTPIYPIAPGIVYRVGSDPIGGFIVYTAHIINQKLYECYYAHMNSMSSAKPGDVVDYNTEIGQVGKTGNAQGTSPHLHFQIWENDQLMDPAKFINVPKAFLSVKDQQAKRKKEKSESQEDDSIVDVANRIVKDDLIFKLSQYEYLVLNKKI